MVVEVEVVIAEHSPQLRRRQITKGSERRPRKETKTCEELLLGTATRAKEISVSRASELAAAEHHVPLSTWRLPTV